ncbi:hypothetical protein DL96DRAFT_1685705 [Flagelloscypha sp. PMI_526]|nr:hypothetical protein DL96DRAFT_1685705 [Flagelloscypha sp. PMI_526]
MDTFPDLSPDIVGLIATTALKHGIVSGRVLSCVSRYIQTLVDPLLFRNLKFGVHQYPKEYIMSQSDRIVRIRPFVWSFQFFSIQLDDFQELVSLHPNIKFLLFDSIISSEFKYVRIPSLTHLSADFHHPWATRRDREGPLFASLTHLDLRMFMYDSIPSIASDLSQMTSLKAMIVGGGRFRGQSFEDVPHALARLPSTLDMIVVWFFKWKLKYHADVGASGGRLISGEQDPRVVVAARFSDLYKAPAHCVALPHPVEHALWDYWGSPQKNVWVAANAVQKSRIE